MARHSRTLRRVLVQAALCLLCLCGPASSAINHNGETGLLRMPTAEVVYPGTMALSLFSESHGPDDKYAPAFPGALLLDQHLALTYGFNPYFECAAATQVHTDKVDNASSETSIGDSRVSAKLIYPPYEHRKEFDLAAIFALNIPSGSKQTGLFRRHVYYAEDLKFSSGDLLLEFLFPFMVNFTQIGKGSPFKLHFMFGADFTTTSATQNMYQAAVGLEYIAKPWLSAFSEISGETKAKKTLSPEMDPLWVTGGLAFTVRQFQIKAGGEYLVSSGSAFQDQEIREQIYKTGLYPRAGAFVSVTLSGQLISQDTDHDGIDDLKDKCPNAAEDLDGFEDADGCPDLDNDKDGIPDLQDKCPNSPEDMDGFEDADGCPDTDNDRDGVPDSVDKCPNAPEDIDGFQDSDGCPDVDNDKDGIPDLQDKCPNAAEDLDGFEDADGCPDTDNDRDNIPDSLDKCPNDPEIVNGIDDKDGCPDGNLKPLKTGESYRMQNVKFKSDESLWESSFPELTELYYYLKFNREVRIEVRVHTDALGSTRANKRKTEAEAQLIRGFLTGKGIEESRVVPVGMGEDHPIAPNDTPAGRLLNNRVEIVRTQ